MTEARHSLLDDVRLGHILPLVAWMLAMHLLGDPADWKYLVRILAGTAALLVFRPWRWIEGRTTLRQLGAGVAVGLLVYVIWVLPEARFWPESWHQWYARIGMQMPWEVTEVETQPLYTGGWAIVRICGACLVIPLIEELAWRGWLYRWTIQSDAFAVPPGTLHIGALLFSSILFASVHTRWLVAFSCGILYALVYIRTRSLWPAVAAHATTNLMLGAHVLLFDQHAFWN